MTFAVLTSVYDTPARLLVECWESLAAQTFKDWHWMVADDGSTDPETIAELDRLAGDPRATLLRLPENRGPGAARNAGLAAIRSDLVAVLDSDDLAESNWLESQAEYMDAHPEVDICGCQIAFFRDSTGETFAQSHHPPVVTRDVFDAQAARGFIWFVNNGGTIFRRPKILALNGYHPTLRRGEDGDLWVRAFQAGLVIHNQPNVLYRYRRHN